jgi:hypothetical protein
VAVLIGHFVISTIAGLSQTFARATFGSSHRLSETAVRALACFHGSGAGRFTNQLYPAVPYLQLVYLPWVFILAYSGLLDCIC